MKCHYEVLGVEQKATDDEIKKSYRKLALEWHPDKNPDRIQECTEYFAVIQQAYDVLSDPHERAWYDRHREQILKGGINEDYVDKAVNLFPYFSGSCYRGFDDFDKGFYTVYRHLFELIAREDLEYITNDADRQIPGFGDSTSDYDAVVHPFYAYWQSYTTAKSFAWLDKYDIRQGENRRVVRAMEKENKKFRDAAKKERNEEVRELIRYVRKRDRRVEVNRQLLLQKRVEREAQVELEREKQRREHKAKLADYKETDWSAKETHDRELRAIEDLLKAQFGSESSSDGSASEGEAQADGEVQPDPVDLQAALADELFCVACEKSFKTRNAYDNHEKSKKHRDSVAELKKQMAADDLALLNLLDTDEKKTVEVNNTSSSGDRKAKNKKRQKKKQMATASPDSDESEVEQETQQAVVNDSTVEAAHKVELVEVVANDVVLPADQFEAHVKPTQMIVDGDEKCGVCGLGFPSRNKLFGHIKSTGHAQLKEMPIVEEPTKKKSKKKSSRQK